MFNSHASHHLHGTSPIRSSRNVKLRRGFNGAANYASRAPLHNWGSEKKNSCFASELYGPSNRRFLKLVPTFADRGVSCDQRDGSLWPYSRFSRPELLFLLSSSSSIVLTRLSGSRSRSTASQKIEPRTSRSAARNSDH
jgi:hypothetical protein